MNKIFVTHDNSYAGETTALRMQAIASIYYYDVLLPTRKFKDVFSTQTKDKIKEASIVLAFVMQRPKKNSTLFKELDYARKRKKPIVIIIRKGLKVPKYLEELGAKIVRLDALNPDNTLPDSTLHEVLEYIHSYKNKPKKSDKQFEVFFTAILAITIGLLLLALTTGDE